MLMKVQLKVTAGWSWRCRDICADRTVQVYTGSVPATVPTRLAQLTNGTAYGVERAHFLIVFSGRLVAKDKAKSLLTKGKEPLGNKC